MERRGNGACGPRAAAVPGCAGAPAEADAESSFASLRASSIRTTASGVGSGELPWKLLGVHSARIDAGTRDPDLDEALGLNCAWYADILLKLTES